MKVEIWETKRIRPCQDNPRVNDQAVEAVARSIETFGFRQPVVVDTDGVIVVGHTRWKAAVALGLAEVPVHVARDLSPEKARAYRIADNKVGELADWNADRLSEEILALCEDFDMTAFGFSAEELSDLIAPSVFPGDPDDMPEPPDEPVTQPGDLWILGDHRLLCGSCLDGADVSRVAGGPMPLAITDPPFEMPAHEQARALRLASVKTAVVLGGGKEIFTLACLEDYRLRFDFVVVYDRSVFMTGKTSLMYRHNRVMLMDYDEEDEVAATGFSNGIVAGRGVSFDRDKWASITATKCSVLQAPVQKNLYGYGKACDVFRAFVRAMQCDSVYDPFGGSGTGMIACEIEGKAWTGVEIRPEVCDIAVKRWEAFTGRKADLDRR